MARRPSLYIGLGFSLNAVSVSHCHRFYLSFSWFGAWHSFPVSSKALSPCPNWRSWKFTGIFLHREQINTKRKLFLLSIFYFTRSINYILLLWLSCLLNRLLGWVSLQRRTGNTRGNDFGHAHGICNVIRFIHQSLPNITIFVVQMIDTSCTRESIHHESWSLRLYLGFTERSITFRTWK